MTAAAAVSAVTGCAVSHAASVAGGALRHGIAVCRAGHRGIHGGHGNGRAGGFRQGMGIFGGYGVGCEKVFPVHSPRVASVETVRKGKVRRAKLYYLRERFGKAAKIKEKD